MRLIDEMNEMGKQMVTYKSSVILHVFAYLCACRLRELQLIFPDRFLIFLVQPNGMAPIRGPALFLNL